MEQVHVQGPSPGGKERLFVRIIANRTMSKQIRYCIDQLRCSLGLRHIRLIPRFGVSSPRGGTFQNILRIAKKTVYIRLCIIVNSARLSTDRFKYLAHLSSTPPSSHPSRCFLVSNRFSQGSLGYIHIHIVHYLRACHLHVIVFLTSPFRTLQRR